MYNDGDPEGPGTIKILSQLASFSMLKIVFKSTEKGKFQFTITFTFQAQLNHLNKNAFDATRWKT